MQDRVFRCRPTIHSDADRVFSIKFKEGECQELWDKMTPSNTGLKMGSLHMWARTDNEIEYKRFMVSVSNRQTQSLGMNSVQSSRRVVDDHREMITMLNNIDNRVGTSPSLAFNDKGIRFEGASLSGIVRRSDKAVIAEDGSFIGSLCPSFEVNKSLGFLHADIPPSIDKYMCNIVSGNETVLTVAPPYDMTTFTKVTMFNTATEGKLMAPDAFVKVSVGGKNGHIGNRGKIASLSTIVSAARDSAITRMFNNGTINLFNVQLINNGTVNIVVDPDASRSNDTDLIEALVRANPEFIRRIKFSPASKTGNKSGIFYCDPATNRWEMRSLQVVEKLLIDMYASMELSDADVRHVRTRRGIDDLVRMLTNQCVDEAFEGRLDANLDLFSVDNGVFDMGVDDGMFRATQPEDNVRLSAGWTYNRVAASEKRSEVDAFMEQVIPLAEERRIVLAYFASLLSGRRVLKKFMTLTDRRAGNNGKSTFVNLFIEFFGSYAKSKTKFVCKGSINKDRDSHDAGMECMRGARLLAVEELKSCMTLDDGLLKKLTGGVTKVEGRRFGLGEEFGFVWSCGFVLVFNEGDCPKFDSGDGAFMQRMIVAPFRSLFTGSPCDEDGPFTYTIDYNIASKFARWTSALVEILLEHRSLVDIEDFNRLPPGMKEWQRGISAEGNPYKDYFEANVTITGNNDDWLLISDLKSDAKGGKDFSRCAEAYFAGFPEVKVRKTTTATVNGVRTPMMRGVVRGVAFTEGGVGGVGGAPPYDDSFNDVDGFAISL